MRAFVLTTYSAACSECEDWEGDYRSTEGLAFLDAIEHEEREHGEPLGPHLPGLTYSPEFVELVGVDP